MNSFGAGNTPIPNQQYGVPMTVNGVSYVYNPPQNYVLEIHIYSSNGRVSGTGLAGGSNSCTLPTGSLSSYGCFWGGFAINNSPSSDCKGIFLAPLTTDILNIVDVWMMGYPNMGTPLATVVQTAGSATNLSQATTGIYAPTTSPPYSSTGYMKLPIYKANNTVYSY